MDFIMLAKILMEWAINSSEYELIYMLFYEFNIGIPVKLLYKLPDKTYFSNLSSFMKGEDMKSISDPFLRKIFKLFLNSKYQSLEEWNNSFGYKLNI